MKDEVMYRILKNRTVAVAAGLAIAFLVFFAAFLFSFKSSYQSYWQAISRVQTVDFNMVAHAFPALVREHIRANDKKSLTQLLESNFSAFTMAVDICVDLECSAFREWTSNQGLTRGELVEIPVFRSAAVPVTVSFKHSYSEKPLVTAVVGQEVLGRLRLYRSEPLALYDEFWTFAKKALSGEAYASRYIAYFSNLVFSLFLSVSFFLFFILVRNYYLEKKLRKGIAILLRKGVMKNYA
ncbi:hypothetical protein [Pseudomonas sp. GOM6]|uniref:hypothetical protein n=1 Tax=Pseudomonas sp. GOM6 TaxID=3036944 RepID=UPI002409838B|nr:hypothetical protein [Pseudomonas sp. GOM6]MDG1581276.1 hypothetical protein [Pseudomonas sp. GOM6]